MPVAQNSYTLLTNTALSVGDNVLQDNGAVTPGPDGRLPTTLFILARVHTFTTGPVTIRVEYSLDGTNWGGGDPAQTMTAFAATGIAAKAFALQYPRFRVVANLAAGAAAFSLGIATA
jgi:hypothetical protein